MCYNYNTAPWSGFVPAKVLCFYAKPNPCNYPKTMYNKRVINVLESSSGNDKRL